MNTMWDSLDQFKTGGWPANYPIHIVKRFYSPQDQDHAAFKCMLLSAVKSIYVSMYGLDDPELVDIIVAKAKDPNIKVLINLDKTQAAGRGEVPLVKELMDTPNTFVAVGMSQFHKINHLKMMVIDEEYLLSGSTNWSMDGESKQNNEATIIRDLVVAEEAIKIIEAEHQIMLSQCKSK